MEKVRKGVDSVGSDNVIIVTREVQCRKHHVAAERSAAEAPCHIDMQAIRLREGGDFLPKVQLLSNANAYCCEPPTCPRVLEPLSAMYLSSVYRCREEVLNRSGFRALAITVASRSGSHASKYHRNLIVPRKEYHPLPHYLDKDPLGR
jgi:hypothetical protein